MPIIIGIAFIIISTIFSIITSIFWIAILPIIAVLALIGVNKNSTTIVEDDVIKHHNSEHLQVVPTEYKEKYKLYLLSKEWKALRKVILKRDKYRCVDCNVKAYHKNFCTYGSKLQVHHIHYNGIENMQFTEDQLVSVCINCHNKRHRR